MSSSLLITKLYFPTARPTIMARRGGKNMPIAWLSLDEGDNDLTRFLLYLIAAGRTIIEIASQLVIALGTVKRHSVNIFNKLDVKNRTKAVAKARDLGLL